MMRTRSRRRVKNMNRCPLKMSSPSTSRTKVIKLSGPLRPSTTRVATNSRTLGGRLSISAPVPPRRAPTRPRRCIPQRSDDDRSRVRRLFDSRQGTPAAPALPRRPLDALDQCSCSGAPASRAYATNRFVADRDHAAMRSAGRIPPNAAIRRSPTRPALESIAWRDGLPPNPRSSVSSLLVPCCGLAAATSLWLEADAGWVTYLPTNLRPPPLQRALFDSVAPRGVLHARPSRQLSNQLSPVFSPPSVTRHAPTMHQPDAPSQMAIPVRLPFSTPAAFPAPTTAAPPARNP